MKNAAQYARREVTVALDWDPDWIEVRITDDGPGFDLAMLDRLGEPYYSTGARDRPGDSSESHLGLGIFISRTLLAHNGADLAFTNQEKGGAAVDVRWPRHLIDADLRDDL